LKKLILPAQTGLRPGSSQGYIPMFLLSEGNQAVGALFWSGMHFGI
jgi:hypothetical protein